MKKIYAYIVSTVVFIMLFTYFEYNKNFQLSSYPPYEILDETPEFNSQFKEYLKSTKEYSAISEELYKIKSKKLKKFYEKAKLYEGKVEFLALLSNGYKLSDFKEKNSFEEIYEGAYSYLKNEREKARLEMFKFFSQKDLNQDLPLLSFMLVDPDIELNDIDMTINLKELVYNKEILAELPDLTKEDLENAMVFYEKAGYRYENREKILNDASFIVEDFGKKYLAMSAIEFNSSKGWKKYIDKKEYSKALTMLGCYALYEGGKLNYADRTLLLWNIAEVLAVLGENEKAIGVLRDIKIPENLNSEVEFMDFNAFIEATIAFLEKDKSNLQNARKKIASGPKLPTGEVANLDIVENYIKDFDHSYKYFFEKHSKTSKK